MAGSTPAVRVNVGDTYDSWDSQVQFEMTEFVELIQHSSIVEHYNSFFRL